MYGNRPIFVNRYKDDSWTVSVPVQIAMTERQFRIDPYNYLKNTRSRRTSTFRAKALRQSSLVSLACNGDGRKQNYLLYFCIRAKTYITKLLKALTLLLNNPEIPWCSNSKWIHIKHPKRYTPTLLTCIHISLQGRRNDVKARGADFRERAPWPRLPLLVKGKGGGCPPPQFRRPCISFNRLLSRVIVVEPLYTNTFLVQTDIYILWAFSDYPTEINLTYFLLQKKNYFNGPTL